MFLNQLDNLQIIDILANVQKHCGVSAPFVLTAVQASFSNISPQETLIVAAVCFYQYIVKMMSFWYISYIWIRTVIQQAVMHEHYFQQTLWQIVSKAKIWHNNKSAVLKVSQLVTTVWQWVSRCNTRTLKPKQINGIHSSSLLLFIPMIFVQRLFKISSIKRGRPF